MACKHERLKCTDNVLRCAACGAVLPLSILDGPAAQPQENAPAAPQRPGKRKPKKEEQKNGPNPD